MKNVFREMREGQEFFDVTLACDDGTYLEAHRIVLAASSTFFRNTFKINNHPHPWIYLKGINSADLTAVIDFMYQGEVNVPQDDLSQFLGIAEDLQVKGLSGYSDLPWTASVEEMNVEKMSNFGVAMNEEQYQGFEGSFDSQTIMEGKESTAVENITRKSEETDIIEEADEMKHHNRILMVGDEPNVIHEKIIEVNAELDKQIEDILIKNNGVWTCKVCGKFANHKSKLKQHVETHIDGFSHPCSLCGKSYRSRNVLRMHMSRDHKNKSLLQ